MKTVSWDEYYEWFESTRVINISCLGSIGSSDEVSEILMELCCDNEKAANRLSKKALDAKTAFSAQDLIDLSVSIDENYINEAAVNSASKFSKEDAEDLSQILDDEIFAEVCSRGNIPLPDGYEYLCGGCDDELFCEDDTACESFPDRGRFCTLVFKALGVYIG